MKIYFTLFSTALCIGASASALAEKRVDIFGILDRFVISNAAASLCYKPAPDELKNFQVQYLNILIASKLEIEKRKPDATEEQVVMAIKSRSEKLIKGVDKEISANGCDTKKATALVKLFKFHAKSNFMAPTPNTK